MRSRREPFRLPKELQLAAVGVGGARAELRPALVPEVGGHQGPARADATCPRSAPSRSSRPRSCSSPWRSCFLVWSRSRQGVPPARAVDGVAIILAGGWAMLLLVYRLLRQAEHRGRRRHHGHPVGHLRRDGRRGRADRRGPARASRSTRPSRRTRPPTTAGWVAVPARASGSARPDRRPRDATAVTEFLRERPSWEGDVQRPHRRPHGSTTRPPPELDDAPTDPPARQDPSEAPTRRERRPEATRASVGRRTTDDSVQHGRVQDIPRSADIRERHEAFRRLHLSDR